MPMPRRKLLRPGTGALRHLLTDFLSPVSAAEAAATMSAPAVETAPAAAVESAAAAAVESAAAPAMETSATLKASPRTADTAPGVMEGRARAIPKTTTI